MSKRVFFKGLVQDSMVIPNEERLPKAIQSLDSVAGAIIEGRYINILGKRCNGIAPIDHSGIVALYNAAAYLLLTASDELVEVSNRYIPGSLRVSDETHLALATVNNNTVEYVIPNRVQFDITLYNGDECRVELFSTIPDDLRELAPAEIIAVVAPCSGDVLAAAGKGLQAGVNGVSACGKHVAMHITDDLVGQADGMTVRTLTATIHGREIPIPFMVFYKGVAPGSSDMDKAILNHLSDEVPNRSAAIWRLMFPQLFNPNIITIIPFQAGVAIQDLANVVHTLLPSVTVDTLHRTMTLHTISGTSAVVIPKTTEGMSTPIIEQLPINDEYRAEFDLNCANIMNILRGASKEIRDDVERVIVNNTSFYRFFLDGVGYYVLNVKLG